MLELKDLCKTFYKGEPGEKRALHHLNLTFADGDFITVIGGNGAGKSTMLNAIAGTYRVDSGQILLNGRDITQLGEHQRAAFLGRVFQDPMTGTAATMTIEENLALAYRRGQKRGLRSYIGREERKIYRDKLAMLGLGLENRMNAQVGLLSGGQRQALTLLMATLRKPEMLLLDEHTAALDPKTAKTVLHLTRAIVEEEHLTALMVTHNMKDALQYGNRTVMLDEGTLILDLQPETKQNTDVSDLLTMFEKASGHALMNDRMLLG